LKKPLAAGTAGSADKGGALCWRGWGDGGGKKSAGGAPAMRAVSSGFFGDPDVRPVRDEHPFGPRGTVFGRHSPAVTRWPRSTSLVPREPAPRPARSRFVNWAGRVKAEGERRRVGLGAGQFGRVSLDSWARGGAGPGGPPGVGASRSGGGGPGNPRDSGTPPPGGSATGAGVDGLGAVGRNTFPGNGAKATGPLGGGKFGAKWSF